MSRYVRKSDRQAQEHEDWLRSELKKSAESGNAEALIKLADIELVKQRSAAKVGPLQEVIDQQSKQLRDARMELPTIQRQLDSAQSRVAELEKRNCELVKERDGLKDDVSRLEDRIMVVADEVQQTNAAKSATDRELEAANNDIAKLRFSVATLAKHVNLSEGFLQELFLKFSDELSLELFDDLGWTREKTVFWSRWLKRSKNIPTESIVDKLHRASCPCSQHEPQTMIRDDGESRVMTDNDRTFLQALLKHRGVEPEIEITKLVETHRQQWLSKNRPALQMTPPISHRQLTPLAGARVVHWGED